ncbi:hypothetical protein B0H10DRAFT_2005409 [Mycena sp. CBHHK59/15]|nr:hypothetical protein B0H10DRAFT_2005409 [Mycena sp. CBHHK59/15]
MRDRNNHPFPPASTSSPAFPQNSHLHQRTLTTSSASASFPASAGANSPAAPTATLSVEALLHTHATTQDPKMAALEQAIAERNVLSSQNSQLWKLIEKQRAGYNQILKELERVRSERDGFKSKLTAFASVSPDRRPRKENGAVAENGDAVRATRSNSDDLPTPRSTQPPRPPIQTSSSSLDISAFPSFQSNSTATPPRQKSVLAPLLVPPRAESLPVPASASGSATQENAPFSNASKLAVRNDSGPLTAQSPRHSPAIGTPQTVLPGFVPPTPHTGRQHAPNPSASTITQWEINPQPQIFTSPGTPVNAPPPAQQQAPNTGMLMALNDSRSQTLSRESRISLPDEARQYIANMGESPIPSPKVDAFAPRTPPSGPAATPQSEFLDMDDEPDDDEDEGDDEEETIEDEEEDEAPEPSVPPTQPLYASRKPSWTQAAASDFPLPPPNVGQPQSQGEAPANTHAQAMSNSQAQAMVNTQAQAMAYQQAQDRAHANAMAQQERALAQQQQQQFTASSDPLISSQSPLQPQRHSPVASTVPASFRALPLLSTDLPHTTVTVSHSFVRPNDRGKEVLSFVVYDGWKVEKMYSDVLALDQRGVGKKMVSLPEAKVDQRKAILETYLQALVNLPVKNNDEVIAFFTSDIVREYKQPVMQAGHKEGYLTKRGKNFGGWKTRFFVLQGPVLEYYDCRGGAHLGSITVTGAQIGRQQRSERPATDEEKEYRHAFLIVEAKRGPGGNHPRHVLCAESDSDRDSWVEMLVRYFSGAYSEELVSYGQPNGYSNNGVSPQSRPSTDVNAPYTRAASPARSIDYSPVDRTPGGFADSQTARRVMEQRPQPSSLPDSSPLSNAATFPQEVSYQRANSEQGYYPDMQNGVSRSRRQHSPEQHRTREPQQKGFQPTLNTVVSSPITPVPRRLRRLLIGCRPPRNWIPTQNIFVAFRCTEKAYHPAVTFIPRAVFGVTLEESLDVAQIANLPAIVFRAIQYLEAKKADQEEGIYRLSGSSAVIKSLKDRFNMGKSRPTVVLRAALIFNVNLYVEGDVDLVGSDEYWDPHAIAGLLKSFLRELPASILTHNLHLRFLSVIDFVDPQERIRELSQLIAALPIANYSLLRALTAHLILIVQNSSVNKMTMRNVGIVFSPTLGIPAGVFSLMLGEFNRVFNVDADNEEAGEEEPGEARNEDGNMLGSSDRSSETHRRRNSRQYSSGAADQLLGLSGRTLTSAEEGPSDDDSVQYESGTETTEDNVTLESTNSSPGPGSSAQHDSPYRVTSPEVPSGVKSSTKASTTATSKGLNVSVTQSSRGNRYSTMMGLPASPRPPQSPRTMPLGADGAVSTPV